MIVWGVTKVTLNQSKCIFGATKLTFLARIISADEVNPEAIIRNKVKLQRFLDMVNYLGKFFPHLFDGYALLRALLNKGTGFLMQKPLSNAFERLK